MAIIKEAFAGFPRETFNFLSELSRNNNKNWFSEHRGAYDAAILSPALSFVQAMGESLQTIAPSVKPEPRVGGSLFRIHRDTRFSVNKSPYKTHVGIRFRDRETSISSKCTGPLFYVEFDAQFLRLGLGIKEFDRRTLSAYRAFVADGNPADRHLTALKEAMERARNSGAKILGEQLTRPPRGFEDHSNHDLLRQKGFFIHSETALPAAIHDSTFVEHCMRWFRPYAPVFESLRKVAVSVLNTET